MKMIQKTTLLALPLLALGGMVFAGGLAAPVMDPATVAPAPVAAPAPMMTGSDWSGLYAGGSLGYGKAEADILGDDARDLTYGVHAGYLHDMGSWVLGAELEYDATKITDDLSGIDLDAVARAKFRAGYDAGAFLPYVTVGAAQAYTSGALEADDTGAFAGLGVDYKVTDSIRVGAEVLRYQFDDFNGTGVDIDATTAAVRVGFSF